MLATEVDRAFLQLVRPSNSGADDEIAMSGIFVSYRRADAPDVAGRLVDGLVARFGRNQVFVDVDSIEGGADFEKRIDRALGTCHAFLAVIGRRWITIEDEDGRRRLDNPEDWVRSELVRALEAPDVEVLPVLINGAKMPGTDRLPAPLRPLVKQQAIELTSKHWRADVERLHERLEGSVNRRARATRGIRRGVARAQDQVENLSRTQQRTYRIGNADVGAIAGSLTGFFRGQKMESQTIVRHDGTLVQGRHPTGWRSFSGMSATLNVGLQPGDGVLTVSVAPGRWADKAAIFSVGTFVALWPLAVTSVVGFWRQRNLVPRAFNLVEQIVTDAGGAEDVTRRRTVGDPDAGDAN
ncbi:MAG TPA: toll/interleukin-1 receptor domain-containing protein [Conexibacter sp.]|jgi:hypothetical protein